MSRSVRHARDGLAHARWRTRWAVPVVVFALLPMLSPARAGALPTGPGEPPLQRLIVELADPSALAAVPGEVLGHGRGAARARERIAERRRDLQAAQQAVLDRAAGAGIAIRPRVSYTLAFNGLAVQLPAGQAARLRELPGVRAVHPDLRMRASVDVSVPLIGAPKLWARSDPFGVPVRGRGITVAVIDTGVDYTHPDLGGGFGAGHKVVAGYDFVNHDADPQDDNGHGTHVAGIIAGNGGVTGVAPEATLTAYKVFDQFGTGSESDILAALEAAVDPANPDAADVVNMSLGGPGDGTEPVGEAATRVVRGGVVVVASAGNGGPGRQTVLTPGAAEGVIAVGASTSGLRVPSLQMTAPEELPLQTFRVGFSANPPAEAVTAEVVDLGEGRPEDYEGLDPSGKVLLIRAQSSAFEAALEAERRGAAAVVFYEEPEPIPDEEGGGIGIGPVGVEVQPRSLSSGDDGRLDRLVVLGMDGFQYAEIARYLGRGPVEVALEGRDSTDELALFSARGPSQAFRLKPELVAPGVEIRSTVPRAIHEPGEFRLSGTSMAAPHVAGAAALLRQLHPADSAGRVAARLVGSATPLAKGGPLDQGAGRLDVAAAADTAVVAEPPALSLGMADLSSATVSAAGTVTLRNTGPEALRVELSGQPAGRQAGEVRVEPSEVTIPAGGAATVSVRVSGPRPEVPTAYAGWLRADAPAGVPDVRVPYLLAAEPLQLHASPDPSDGRSEVFVYSPADLEAPPEVVLTARNGQQTELTASFDHGKWWRATVDAAKAGVYTLSARARTTASRGGVTLFGQTTVEVLAPEYRGPGAALWTPVGPNADAGPMAVTQAGPTAPDQVVVSSGQLSLWVSTDAASSWRRLRDFPVAGGSGPLIVDPADGRRMWYAVNGGSSDPTYHGKILRTVDRGRSWAVLDFPNVEVQTLVTDDAGRTLVALAGDALYLSRDGGDSWEPRPIPWSDWTNELRVIGGDLYAATFGGLYVIRDFVGGGRDAELAFVAPGFWAAVFDVVGDEKTIVTNTFSDGLFASRDGGRTWTPLYQPPSRAQFVTMKGDDIFVGTFSANFVSHDRGATWSEWSDPLGGGIETDLAGLHWRGERWLLASPGAGLFTTSDEGRTYERVGVQSVTVHDLAVARDGDGEHVLAGTEHGVYERSLPTGRVEPETAEWGSSGAEGSFGTVVHNLVISPADSRVIWKVRKEATDHFWVYRSGDGGATWELKTRTFETPGGMLVHPADPRDVYVGFWSLTGQGLLRSTDDGETWKKLFHGMTFEAIAGDPRNADRLWLGNERGLWRSDDGGVTVTRVADGPITAITIDPRRPDRIVAGGATLLVSSDGGKTFVEADAGGLQMSVSDLAVSPEDPDHLFAATMSHYEAGLIKNGRGVLESRDGGQVWENASGGLQDLSVTALAFGGDGRWLFAGTTEGGVHRLAIPR